MSHKKFCDIETQRVILRKFKKSDVEAFLKYRSNPQVALYQGWEDYKSEQAIEFINEQMNFEPNIPDTWFQIAVELKETNILIGDCAIHTLKEDSNQVEIGFTLEPMYQNKGLAVEAIMCLFEIYIQCSE